LEINEIGCWLLEGIVITKRDVDEEFGEIG
jgi:hypothetical protein